MNIARQDHLRIFRQQLMLTAGAHEHMDATNAAVWLVLWGKNDPRVWVSRQ